MKPTHSRTPRSLKEGHWTCGYTTQPVGRSALPRWVQRLLDVMTALVLGLMIALFLVQALTK